MSILEANLYLFVTVLPPAGGETFFTMLQCYPPPEAKLFYYVTVLPHARGETFFIMLQCYPPPEAIFFDVTVLPP